MSKPKGQGVRKAKKPRADGLGPCSIVVPGDWGQELRITGIWPQSQGNRLAHVRLHYGIAVLLSGELLESENGGRWFTGPSRAQQRRGELRPSYFKDWSLGREASQAIQSIVERKLGLVEENPKHPPK